MAEFIISLVLIDLNHGISLGHNNLFIDFDWLSFSFVECHWLMLTICISQTFVWLFVSRKFHWLILLMFVFIGYLTISQSSHWLFIVQHFDWLLWQCVLYRTYWSAIYDALLFFRYTIFLYAIYIMFESYTFLCSTVFSILCFKSCKTMLLFWKIFCFLLFYVILFFWIYDYFFLIHIILLLFLKQRLTFIIFTHRYYSLLVGKATILSLIFILLKF